MVRIAIIAALAAVISTLGACAHVELTAPCKPSSSLWSSSAYAAPLTGSCGQMRPVNQ